LVADLNCGRSDRARRALGRVYADRRDCSDWKL
jgi:hypothetical protein